jgi:hypothetical protein
MTGFPALDPIPLPAPVWLLKALHTVTMALHFTAMQMMVGGLATAAVLSLIGRSSESKSAARAMASRLPVVMTYVINFGVPPLLFAQVLYGPALYTSSVLIGSWWISVIPLLTLCYFLLYRFSARLEGGRSAWWLGLIAWGAAGLIAQIYSSNMTLMLRPETWQAMYSASPAGVALPSGDPSLPARLSFALGGGFTMAGLWMIWLSGRSPFAVNEKRFLANWGGRIAAAAAILQVALGSRVFAVQPAVVQRGLGASQLYQSAYWAWVFGTALIFLVAGISAIRGSASGWLSWAAPLLAIIQTGSTALFRDGIRDLSLRAKGFDVWNRTVVTNWSVVGLFLALFVAGLVVTGWLISVVARAKTAVAKAA